MFRPFPGDLVGEILKGRKGVVVLERTDQPLAEDLPLMREMRAAITKCARKRPRRQQRASFPTPAMRRCAPQDDAAALLRLLRPRQPRPAAGRADRRGREHAAAGRKEKFFYLSIDFLRDKPCSPRQELHQQKIEDAYPQREASSRCTAARIPT